MGGREREREINNNVRNIDLLPLVHAPDQGLNPQPSMCFDWGIEPIAFQFVGRCSNQLSHTGQGNQINKKVLSRLVPLLPYPSDLVLTDFLRHSPESNVFPFFEGEFSVELLRYPGQW